MCKRVEENSWYEGRPCLRMVPDFCAHCLHYEARFFIFAVVQDFCTHYVRYEARFLYFAVVQDFCAHYLHYEARFYIIYALCY